MVIPLINESEWAPRLAGLPTWTPKDVPTVIVVPHPDDETLATGGLIAALRNRGVDVTVVAVTDGENAYTDNDGLAAIRREEQSCALERLGIASSKIIRLGFTDSSVAANETELAANLRPLLHAETQILAPWSGDFHPDHESCARASSVAARESGATLISYFFWTWHRGTVATLDGLDLRQFVLDENLRHVKAEALACHKSQFKHAAEPEILPEHLLWPARMACEVFAL